MSSVVVVDDVSPVVWATDVNGIRYCGSGVVGVPKTQHAILFVFCVRDIDVVAKKPTGVIIPGI